MGIADSSNFWTGFDIWYANLQEEQLQNASNGNYNSSDDEVLIFPEAVKKYLHDEFNISNADLSKGIDINKLLSMDYVDGKLVDPEEEAKKEAAQANTINAEGKTGVKQTASPDGSEQTAGTNDEGTNIAADGTESATLPVNKGDADAPQPANALTSDGEILPDEIDPEQATFNDVLNWFLENENFANAVDNNHDGEFTKEELDEFFNHINSTDGDDKNLTIDDLLGAFTDIQLHSGNDVQETEDVETQDPEKAVSGPVGVFGGGGGIKTREKTLDNMTREELEAELDTAQQTLSDNQTTLENAISGNTPELIQLQEKIDSAYDKYLEELELVDEEMAEELDGLVNDITAKEGEITDKEQEIADQENTVSEAEGAYNNAVSTREALESQLGLLQAALGKETDETKKAEIQGAIDSVEAQIRDAERAEKDAKDAWDAEQKKLDDLNDEKVALEGELETLKSSKAELEGQIDEKYPEVAEYKNAYNEAKTAYDTAKANAINDAKAKVSESQKYVNDVKSALNDRDIRDLAKDNLKSISAFSQYNEERGQALADAALALYGNDYYANGNCAGGVADAIQKAFGYRTYGNGCDYGNVLSQLDDWIEVTQEITSVEDLRNLPPGAIVSWSTYEAGHTKSNGRFGHVWISDGQGHEISDFIANVSLNYSAWGASFRVFLPR